MAARTVLLGLFLFGWEYEQCYTIPQLVDFALSKNLNTLISEVIAEAEENSVVTRLLSSYGGDCVAEETLGSISSNIGNALQLFSSDSNLRYLTKEADRKITPGLLEQGISIDLLIEDRDLETYAPILSLAVATCITYLSSPSREKAVTQDPLHSQVVFVLDELGRLPEIQGLPSILQIGRSRGCTVLGCLQSWSSAEEHYGEKVASDMLTNFSYRVFLQCQPVTPVPNSHPSIEGIFMPRDTMITAIDLKNCLGRGESEKKGLFIVTNFNKLDIAFHVEAVLGIHRVSWRDIIKPDITISAADESVATGIIKKNDKLIIILDFEKIVSDINPETGLKMSELNELGERTRSSVPILIAEDSPLLNKLIVDSLKAAGYVNLIHTENGQQAYDVITQCKEDGTLDQHVRCIITDIEMPEMDGHRLTKLVKSDDATKDIPIIIFSSLVNDEMKKKGEALGADAQLSKPEIGNLVKIVDELVAERHLDR